MSEKRDMNQYFREKFGTDNLRKAQTILGHKVTAEEGQDVNAYFRGKYGTDNLEQVQTKLDQARARGELPPGTPVVTIEKTVEKEVTRTPSYEKDAILILDAPYLSPEQLRAEVDKQKADAIEKLRSQTVNEGDQAFSRVYPSPLRIVQSPIKTLKEERSWVEKKSAEQLKGIILSLQEKIEMCIRAPQAAREKTLSSTRSQFEFPDNPTQKEEIKKIVELKMAGYREIFEKINKALPYLEEMKQMYAQVLEEKVKTEAVQQDKVPKILREMEELSKSAAKLYPKITKLLSEYQITESENILERLTVVVEEYTELQSQWSEEKRGLYELDVQPQFPPMPDLPVLPRKLWKKIQQQS